MYIFVLILALLASALAHASYTEVTRHIISRAEYNKTLCINMTTSEAIARGMLIMNRLADARAKCSGRRNALRCETHRLFGTKYSSSTLTNRMDLGRMKTPPTPWLTIGEVGFYGNDYLDYLLFEMFFQRNGDEILRNGTYLEAGATNGVHASNTLFYDSFLNWNGILIEPTPCAICQLPFNRPHATIIYGGICPTNTTLDNNNELIEFCPGGQGDCIQGSWPKYVRCEPLLNYFQYNNYRKVDLMSIDIEQYYMNALRSIDFNVTEVRVIVIECDAADCFDFLIQKGYSIIKPKTLPGVNVDTIAWKNDIPGLCF